MTNSLAALTFASVFGIAASSAAAPIIAAPGTGPHAVSTTEAHPALDWSRHDFDVDDSNTSGTRELSVLQSVLKANGDTPPVAAFPLSDLLERDLEDTPTPIAHMWLSAASGYDYAHLIFGGGKAQAPEPGTMFLVGFGVAGMAARRRAGIRA